MAKTIKFNLFVDGTSVRDLEGLREHFNLDDLLELYRNGTLLRWLKVRGYAEQAKAIEGAPLHDDDLKMVRHLADVLGKDLDIDKESELVFGAKLRRESEKRLRELEALKFEERKVIEAHHDGFRKLKDEMRSKRSDLPILKASVREIHDRYRDLFELNVWDFEKFYTDCPLVLFAVMKHDGVREAFLEEKNIRQDLLMFVDKLAEKDIESDPVNENEATVVPPVNQIIDCFNENGTVFGVTPKKYIGNTNSKWIQLAGGVPVLVLDMTKSADVKVKHMDWEDFANDYGVEYCSSPVANAAIGQVFFGLAFYSRREAHYVTYIELNTVLKLENPAIRKPVQVNANPGFDALKAHVRSFAGVTDGYWKTLVPADRKCLILRMESGNFVRNEDKKLEELGADEINGKFPILDGIAYKSNNADHKLLYMEV